VSESDAEVQQQTSQVVTFAQLFLQESNLQQEEREGGKDDIVITDTSCK
jgi:hypothetical protein